MSYQVLARKWRPRSFDEMVGQEHVLKALVNGLDNDRLHHAYLFTGTRGVGKTTLARIIAKCLNCERGVSSTPCGECSACVAIAEGRFVDLLEVDAASRTKVEDTRDLLDNVQYLPTSGRYKVYLIDEVHMLSTHSFNALLKTLEEPPPHVKFLLATTDPQKLPVTVLSRCLQFNLKNLGPERIVSHLKFVLAEEKVPFEEDALWDIGRAADGSMRDALSLTDQAIAHGGGLITQAEVSAMLGTIDRAGVVEICAAVARGDAVAALAAVQQLADHAPDYSEALGEMLSFWHRVAIAQTAPDALDHSHADHQHVLQLAAALDRETVQLFYQITLLGRRDLPHAADPRSGFEMVLLRLLAFQPVLPESLADQPLPGRPLPQENPQAKKPDPAPPPAPLPAGATVSSASNTSAPAAMPSVERASTERASAAIPSFTAASSTSPTPTQGVADRAASPSVSAGESAVAQPQEHLPEAVATAVRGEEETPAQSAVSAEAAAAKELSVATPALGADTEGGAVPPLSQVERPSALASEAVADADRPPWEEYEAVAESELSADHLPAAHLAAGHDGALGVAAVQPAAAQEEQCPAPPVSLRAQQDVTGLVDGGADTAAPRDRTEPSALEGKERPAAVALTALNASNWLDVYLGLEVGGLLQSIAANLYLDGIAGGRLDFILDSGHSSLYREEQQARLAELLSHYFNENVQVVIQIGEPAGETPRQVLQRRRAERLQQAVESLHQDPLVRKLIDHTAGELLEHSVRPLD